MNTNDFDPLLDYLRLGWSIDHYHQGPREGEKVAQFNVDLSGLSDDEALAFCRQIRAAIVAALPPVEP